MSINESIFKAYDIRGIYPDELNEDLAYKIGRAFVVFMKCKEVMVGYDMRTSSGPLFGSLVKGITDQGADVSNIGLCSTPLFYYACREASAGVMVTASHNPSKYNGFKLCRENAIPISGETGIMDIKELAKKGEFPASEKKGEVHEKDIMDDFIKFSISFLDKEKIDRKFKIVVDCGNGMGGYTYPKVFGRLEDLFEAEFLYEHPDGTFPNHEANPLKDETLAELKKRVVAAKADLGIALDGDGDRCRFIDEKGEAIDSDLMTALLARSVLKKHPGGRILYDLRSSWVVKEIIEENGGKAVMCRVGHSFIKKQMREEGAVFAGELSGHYYFTENKNAENTFLAVFHLINLLAGEKKPLSGLAGPLKKYFPSGEINSQVEDKEGVMKKLEKRYGKDARKVSWLDGIYIEFEDWWFNVRASNTEPLLRLNLEAKTKELMEEKRDEVLKLIRD